MCVYRRVFDLLNVSIDKEKHTVLGFVFLHQYSVDQPIGENPLLLAERDFLKETNQLVNLVRGQKTKARERGQVTRKLGVYQLGERIPRYLVCSPC